MQQYKIRYTPCILFNFIYLFIFTVVLQFYFYLQIFNAVEFGNK